MEHGIISNDILELRKGIKYILDNPEDAKRMVLNAFKVVVEKFDPGHFQNNWRELFEKMLK
jgi:glycosyltransferase involved in cell wall biosynthesis